MKDLLLQQKNNCDIVNRKKHVSTVNGNWGAWSAVSDCSVTCGVGLQTHRRDCDNPPPKYGGQDCPGDNTKSLLCKDPKHCPGETHLLEHFYSI